MGHDFITLHDRHVHLHDMTIWTLRHFCVVASVDVDRDTQPFFAAWQTHGPGVFTGTDLHEFGDAPRLDLLRRVFVRAREIIAGFGDSIPLAYLEDHINKTGFRYTQDAPTANIVDAVDRILAMFSDD